MARVCCWLAALLLSAPLASAATPDDGAALADELRQLSTDVLPPSPAAAWSQMVRRNLNRRLQAANQQSTADWRKLNTRADWERFRDERIAALRRSLGEYPQPPADLRTRVVRTLQGEGYEVDLLVYQSRPGLWVTANLYRPRPARASMPAIILSHSHNRPQKSGDGYGSLDRMGVTWARAGCLVLVPDHLGHDERRQHAYRTADDYAGEFRPTRQDYYFRYDTGVQLQLVGDSLTGWMVWDLRRGVDLLLNQPGVDPRRLLMLGVVAGGADVAAVAAALDPRITAVAPFNFGGPQPETSARGEDDFNYAGSGSWESTRNLPRSASDQFLPWVTVAAAAPRPLIYGHEFAWSADRDPVWKRLERVYSLYDARDKLAVVHGSGSVTGHAKTDTHWTALHREAMYPHLQRWWKLPHPDQETRQRRPGSELLVLDAQLAAALPMRPLREIALPVGDARQARLSAQLDALKPEQRLPTLRARWRTALNLGELPQQAPQSAPLTSSAEPASLNGGDVAVQRVALVTEPDIRTPVLLLIPRQPAETAKRLCVLAFAQQGKQRLLQERREEFAKLLAAGWIVALTDVRGCGETAPSADRGPYSGATSLSATSLMLGQPVLGDQLRDLRGVIAYLRERDDVAADGISLWGDSLATTNPADYAGRVPRRVNAPPAQAEPLGATLAVLAALDDPRIASLYACGGLLDYGDLLRRERIEIPHDALIPGMYGLGLLETPLRLLAARPVCFAAPVDGLNRRLSPTEIDQTCRRLRLPTTGEPRLLVTPARDKGAQWLLGGVR